MSGVGERIRERREALGLSRAELAEKAGVSLTTFQNWEMGNNEPTRSRLQSLAQALECPFEWLRAGPPKPKEEPAGASPPKPTYGRGLGKPEKVRSAVTRRTTLDAPKPSLAGFETPAMSEAALAPDGDIAPSARPAPIALRTETLRRLSERPEDLILTPVLGRAMEPTLKEGDLFLIDPARRRVDDGHLYALAVAGAVRIKRLYLMASGHIRVISDNQKDYPAEELPADQVHILGQVVWFARELV